jgi:hypothetical protein
VGIEELDHALDRPHELPPGEPMGAPFDQHPFRMLPVHLEHRLHLVRMLDVDADVLVSMDQQDRDSHVPCPIGRRDIDPLRARSDALSRTR